MSHENQMDLPTTFLVTSLATCAMIGCAKPDASSLNKSTNNPPPIETTDKQIPKAPKLLPETLLPEGWINLFDGNTLFGWNKTGDANWHVEDDRIVANDGEASFLYTTTTFSEYVLSLEFRCDQTTNSGVFLHMPPTPQDPTSDCYEVNVAPPDNPFPTGSLVGRQRVDVPATTEPWNHYKIVVTGTSLSVELNGNSILEYHDKSPIGRGHIGLQHNQGKIEFRNIRLKPLTSQPIFNGKDLDGWNIKPDLESKFSVTPEGHLSIQNGKGQIETKPSYADFVLQLECKTLGDELNSGVFFRCIPGDLWMGYESQIHNGFDGGDPTRPSDCGTGGIFRRQNARRIVAKDHQWFYKTIIADGPHMAVWVNGYQVSDWTDQRLPHKNPRKGLRTQAGTIILQGHDPTTDLLFRNFRISTMNPRVDG